MPCRGHHAILFPLHRKDGMIEKMKWRDLLNLTGVPVFIAGLCCFSPLALVALGLSSTVFAADLADLLYGGWKWAFRTIGFLFLVGFLVIFFRRKGICTLNTARRRRNEIINTILIALIVGVVGYIVWLYVIVHYAGVWLGIWQ